MTGTLREIWRHPIKSHGREALTTITLEPGRTLPWDRTWAVAHEMSKADGSTWVPCANFSRVAKAPALMAIEARLDPEARQLVLTHPDLTDLAFWPDTHPEALIDWVRPLMPENRAAPKRLIKVPGRGLTDSDFPSVTLCNYSSHRAVEQKLGQDMSIHRWRGNLWFDGLGPWEEFEWIGREVQIGKTRLVVRERTDRCMATAANPLTGLRDADTLGALRAGWDHEDFSIRAEVTQGGEIALGDTITLLRR
ncbi:MAG: MOSC N-terminal beta barrel domain-containing protein [Pseudomonadota bacterium]